MSMLCRALGHAVPCFPNDNIHYFRSNLRAMSNKRKNSDTSEDSGSSKQARLSFATDSKTEKDENAMDTSSNVKRLKNGYPVSDSQEADLTWGHDDAELYPFIEQKWMPISERGLYCRICINGKKTGHWSTVPFRSVRASHVEKHVRSTAHTDSVKMAAGQTTLTFTGGATKPGQSKDEDIFNAWIAKFDCIYTCATQEVALAR
jgi:hypothetical protein